MCVRVSRNLFPIAIVDSMTEADLSGMDWERGTSPVGHYYSRPQ